MKIKNDFLFNVKFTICILIIYSGPLKVNKNKIFVYDQKYPYQDLFEAPVTKDQMLSPNYTIPSLSHSLFEENPRRKLRIKDFISTVKYSLYSMTRGEIEQIFYFADMNRDDLVDQMEWDAFATLFIYPFEACDINHDYILTLSDFKKCFDADPRTKLINFVDQFSDNHHELIMDIVSTRGKRLINFSDYLIIRRALFGWKECQSTSIFISLSAFKCAIKVAVPQKYHLKLDLEKIYNAGLKLSNDPGLVELEFISYLRILYYTYVFSVFSSPQDVPFIEKQQFIKAIREDRFPTGFNEKEIEYIFELINTSPMVQSIPMNFESFCFFLNIHRLFQKHAKSKPMQINIDELNAVLDDSLTPTAIKLSIDNSMTKFDTSVYMEASLVLQRLRVNERDFYFSFKSVDGKTENNEAGKIKPSLFSVFQKEFRQPNSEITSIKDHSKTKSSRSYKFKEIKAETSEEEEKEEEEEKKEEEKKEEVKKEEEKKEDQSRNKYYIPVPVNKKNRYYFYLTMCGADKLSWTKLIFYRAFTLSNLYIELVKDQRFIVSISDILDVLPDMYDTINPPINLNQRDNYLFWKNMPREAHVDICSFLAAENYRNKFELHKLNKLELINETLLRMVMRDFGWSRMPDTVIDLAKRGYDQLRRRMYHGTEVFKYMMITHIAGSENERSKMYQKRYKLTENKDFTRKYPQLPRRFSSSPLI